MIDMLLTPIRTFVICIVRISKSPGSTIFTVATVGVILSLPAGFFTVSTNLKQITEPLESSAEITVFISKTATDSQVDELLGTVQRLPEVKTAEIITEDEALEDFKSITGLHSIIEFIPDNPLPKTIIVQAHDEFSNVQTIQQLVDILRGETMVDAVEIDLLWIQRLFAIVDLSRFLFAVISGLLFSIATLLICNTTRISVVSRSDEIYVIQQIGGTNAFIRRPFVYIAVIHGMMGLGLAFAIVEGIRRFLAEPVREIAMLYNSQFELVGLSLPVIAASVVSVAILTWLSARITVNFYLKRHRE